MIIQTGQRTDIPAFYAPWFLRRLEEGGVPYSKVYTRRPNGAVEEVSR